MTSLTPEIADEPISSASDSNSMTPEEEVMATQLPAANNSTSYWDSFTTSVSNGATSAGESISSGAKEAG